MADGIDVQRRALPLLVAAVGISMFGDLLAFVPIALHLQEATGSGIVVALMFVALWSPMFFLAAPAGLLVDRHEPRRILLFAVLAQAVVASVLAFTSGTVAILALTALLGAGGAFAQPAEFAPIPSVARGDVRRELVRGDGTRPRLRSRPVGGRVAGSGGWDEARAARRCGELRLRRRRGASAPVLHVRRSNARGGRPGA